MEELINNLTNFIGQFGLFSGLFLVFLESIIPILPLSVFVAVNVLTYGEILGFLVSYIGTILGCTCAYFMCRKFNDYFEKKYKKNKKVKDIKKRLRNIKLSTLVIILAIPFTPAFSINLAAGLTKYDFKKYFTALVIGKIPMIYFWAFIGASLKESLTDVTILIKIGIMLLAAYIVSRAANKALNK